MDRTDISNFSIRELLRPIFRQKLIIIISCVTISVIVYIGLLFQTPLYEARVLIHIKGMSVTEAPTYGPLGPFRIHLTQMAIVKSNPVIKRAAQALGLENRPLDYEKKFCNPLKTLFVEHRAEKEREHLESLTGTKKEEFLLWKAMNYLKDNIATNLEANTDIFEIVVRDYSPEEAVEIANVVSRSYTIYDLQQQLAELTLKYGDLHPTIQQLQDNIQKMMATLNGKEMSDLDAIGSASVKIIEQASTDYRPIGKPKSILMLVGVFIGSFVGFALAFFFDMFTQTFKSPQEIVQHLNIPAIGTIPKTKLFGNLLIEDVNAETVYTEFYNDLADQMFVFTKVQTLRTLLFISALPHHSNAAITTNLGLSFSQKMVVNTLVVNANPTNPLFQKMPKIDENRGLADILEDTNLDIDTMLQSINDNLHVLPAGNFTQDTIALINDKKIKFILGKMKNQFEAVFIDCTFIKKISDIAVLTANVDGVVLVINEGKDHIQVARSVMHSLQANKANIIGGILNNRTFPIPDFLYKRI